MTERPRFLLVCMVCGAANSPATGPRTAIRPWDGSSHYDSGYRLDCDVCGATADDLDAMITEATPEPEPDTLNVAQARLPLTPRMAWHPWYPAPGLRYDAAGRIVADQPLTHDELIARQIAAAEAQAPTLEQAFAHLDSVL